MRVAILLFGLSSLVPASAFANCGNEYLEHGEACDDGNAIDGDGCSSVCQVESGNVCTAQGVAWPFPESTPEGADGSVASGWDVSVTSATSGYVPLYETAEGIPCASHLGGAGWVSPNAAGGCAGDVIRSGSHWFRTRFAVTQAQLDAGSITLTYGHDNSLEDISLNGTSLGISFPTDRYTPDGTLTLTPNDLALGQNELVFRVFEPQGNNPVNYSGVSVRQRARFTCVQSDAPPETTLTGTPISPSFNATPGFAFASTEPGTFQCSIDGAPFVLCTSPFMTSALALGNHVVAVRAIDGANNVDPTPATFAFVVGCTTGIDIEANCGDSDACTHDSCANFVCVHAAEPPGTACGSEMTCDPRGGCSGCANDTQCGDGNVCTQDHCRAGTCVRTRAAAQACELSEGRSGVCQNDAPFACLECGRDQDCASGHCDLTRNACATCTEASHCDDQNECTRDVCLLNACQHAAQENSSCTTELSTNGSCRADARCVECRVDSECNTEQRCDDGICVARAGINPDLDPDHDGLDNRAECPRLAQCADTDGDGQPDANDNDDDNDDVGSAIEVRDALAFGRDVDLDGRKNWQDSDADGDGLIDGLDGHGPSERGIPSYLDAAARHPQGGLAGAGGCAVGSPGSRLTFLRLGLVLTLLAWLFERRRVRTRARRRFVGSTVAPS